MREEFQIKYRQLETPLYYEYESGWNALLEYAPTMIMLILLILSFLVAGIFSNEFQLKAEDIFFSSKLGRDRAVACKIGAGLLIVTVVYWLTMCAYSAIVLLTLRTDGGNCAIQIGLGGWKSFYNITYFFPAVPAVVLRRNFCFVKSTWTFAGSTASDEQCGNLFQFV